MCSCLTRSRVLSALRDNSASDSGSSAPQVIPAGECAKLTLSEESRAWTEGEVLFFDDSFEHEVRNRCAHHRAVLQVECLCVQPLDRWQLQQHVRAHII